MNVKFGLIIFVISIVIAALIRSFLISHTVKKKSIMKFELVNSSGCYVGIGIYLISIFFLGLGPLSFEVANINFTTYLILNIIAGLGYGITFPPLSPITNSGNVYVLKNNYKIIAYVGRYMGRRFNVISLPTEDRPTMIVKRLNSRCEFEVISDQDSTSPQP